MAKFIPAPNLEEKIKREPELRRALREAAEQAAQVARQRAPVASGRLRDSIGVEETEEGFRVVADVDYAAFQEFGTERNRAHPYLRPAGEATFEKFTPGG